MQNLLKILVLRFLKTEQMLNVENRKLCFDLFLINRTASF